MKWTIIENPHDGTHIFTLEINKKNLSMKDCTLLSSYIMKVTIYVTKLNKLTMKL